MPSRVPILLLALIGLMAVSHGVIFVRLAGDAPALFLATARVAIGTILFAPVAWIAWRRGAGINRRSFALSVLAGLCLAVHFGTWIESVQRLSIAESAILVSLSPVWIAVIETVLGRGLPSRKVLLGIALCLLGVGIIGYDGASRPVGDPVGLVLAGIGGLSMAGYLLIGQKVRSGMPTALYVTICYGTAAVALAVFSLPFGAFDPAAIGGQALIAALALGLVCQGIGHSAYNHALGRLSPIFVAICLLGEPVLSCLLGVVYLDESIPIASAIGGIPILIGVWLALLEEVSRLRK